MRSMCAIAAWTLLLDVALAPASAQEWFPLAKSEPLDGRVMDGTQCRWLPRAGVRPADLKGVPARLGRDAGYFSVVVNGRRTWLMVSSAPAKHPSDVAQPLELIADTNQNGDLSDEVPVLRLGPAGDAAARDSRSLLVSRIG